MLLIYLPTMRLRHLVASSVLSLPLILFWSVSAISGEFRVSPIKLFFEPGTKTGVITISNEGEGPIRLQMKGLEWTQDADGKDHYEPTDNLIYFPKFMELGKGEKRVLRTGIKRPGTLSEATYRLYIEEIPIAKEERDPGSFGVNILIQFGVPIFVKPVKEEVKGSIESLSLEQGKLLVQVKNTGNSHFRIESIKIKGLDVNGVESFSKELSGWYLLEGAHRVHETAISQEICQDTAIFDVEVRTVQFVLNDQLDVIKSLCLP
jgi:fimbrial chaperone protein